MSKKFTIAICQMVVVDDKYVNLKRAENMIQEAGQDADLVVLPEMFNCPYDIQKFPEYAEDVNNSPTLAMASMAAQKAGVILCAGSIPERENDNIYNTSFIFNPQGEIIGRHRKMHLFDINVPGEIYFRESETLTPGDDVTVLGTSLANIGVCICYDIRFPELFRLMTDKGAELILVPGAFNPTTGPAHWETIIRTRAIDNQVFMAAASPARNMDASYLAYGHSMVSDPWGEVMVEAGSDEKIIYTEIELGRVDKVRQELPLLINRRNDRYEIIEKREE